MTYVLSFIKQHIPPELLKLAFKPTKFNTTVEQRILSEVIEPVVLLDANLVGGRRRDIVISQAWEMNLPMDNTLNIMGTGVQSAFYKIPEEHREYRNISSVIGIAPAIAQEIPTGLTTRNGRPAVGNSAQSMLSEMLTSRTFSNFPRTPNVGLEGTNIIRFSPRDLAQGTAVSVMLEYDAEFLGLNVSGIHALRALSLCAVQMYIATQLRVTIDETEVVAGMEIGVIKTLVDEYAQKAEQYPELLMKMKGSMLSETRMLSQIIRYAL